MRIGGEFGVGISIGAVISTSTGPPPRSGLIASRPREILGGVDVGGGFGRSVDPGEAVRVEDRAQRSVVRCAVEPEDSLAQCRHAVQTGEPLRPAVRVAKHRRVEARAGTLGPQQFAHAGGSHQVARQQEQQIGIHLGKRSSEGGKRPRERRILPHDDGAWGSGGLRADHDHPARTGVSRGADRTIHEALTVDAEAGLVDPAEASAAAAREHHRIERA